MKTFTFALIVAAACTARADTSIAPPLLYDGLAFSGDAVIVSHAGRLWSIPVAGGAAARLTTGGQGEDTHPAISQDGSQLAFTRTASGNSDVYVMPVAGGFPKRLTYNPKGDMVRGWTPDGTRVVFSTNRDGDGLTRLYTIAVDGVWPEPLPVPQGERASFSPDGARMVYNPVSWPYDAIQYRYYRGGMTSPLWVLDFADHSVEVVEGNESNHYDPRWVGGTIFYLGDRTGSFNLYAYDVRARRTEQLTAHNDYGIRWYDASTRGIVYAQGGRLFKFDGVKDTAREIEFTIEIEAPELEPTEESASRWMAWARPSADGKRIVYEARGDIFVHDSSNDTAQAIASTPSIAERSPIFSPDGTRIAYFSDESGEYELHILDIDTDAVRAIAIEDHPTFYREPAWSPDGRYIVFDGKRLELWLADLQSGTARVIATSNYLANDTFRAAWSPGSNYIAYASGTPNHNRDLFLYDIANDTHHQITRDTFADAPSFDRSGRYLYYIGSNNAALAGANNIWGLLSAIQSGPVITKTVNAVVLHADQPAPLLPVTNRPHPNAQFDTARSEPIDFDGIQSRTIQLPLAGHDYTDLAAGKPGEIMVVYSAWPDTPGAPGGPSSKVCRVDLRERPDLTEIASGAEEIVASNDGSAIVFGSGSSYQMITAVSAEPQRLSLGRTKIAVDRRGEWRQMFQEAWRLMRDYFYDHDHHGQDLGALEAHYAAYVPNITRREDLNNLFREMLGEISISHMAIGGGDVARSASGRPERIGLLGGEFEIDSGRYRIAKIYRRGHAQEPNGFHLSAPLDQPGIDIREGDYILRIGKTDVDATKNLYTYLDGTVGNPAEIAVSSKPEGGDIRTYIVVPIAGENGLKRGAWFAENRKRVEELSGGRLQYIAISGYGPPQINGFIGDAIAGLDKDGYVIDQRFNGGGITSDVLVQMLTRDRYHHYRFPHGEDLTVPTAVPRGAKVLIVNESNFSAAETFPLMFQIAGVGTIAGKRTGGGGTGGALHYPPLIDGGRITIPNRASYNWKTGQWAENDGVHPDVEVEWWPADWMAGRDPQLERAVELALEAAAVAPDDVAHLPAPAVHPR